MKLSEIKHISAILVRERYPNEHIIGLFADTMFEHPITYNHLDKITNLYNLEKVVVCAGSVENQILRNKRFPSDNARFCTSALKIQPAKKWLVMKAMEGFSVINYIGVRANESPARKVRYCGMSDELMMPHEFLPSQYPKYMGESLNIRFCIPIVEWSTEDVFEFIKGEHNPLYDDGFESVGCFPCMAGGDKWKQKAFAYDAVGAQHYKMMKRLEPMVIANKHYPIFTSAKGKKAERENSQNGCSFCSI